MRTTFNLSTNLLIVLAADKKRRTAAGIKPVVSGIKVDKPHVEVRKTVTAQRPAVAETLFSFPY